MTKNTLPISRISNCTFAFRRALYWHHKVIMALGAIWCLHKPKNSICNYFVRVLFIRCFRETLCDAYMYQESHHIGVFNNHRIDSYNLKNFIQGLGNLPKLLRPSSGHFVQLHLTWPRTLSYSFLFSSSSFLSASNFSRWPSSSKQNHFPVNIKALDILCGITQSNLFYNKGIGPSIEKRKF